jgi:hypothetical protein
MTPPSHYSISPSQARGCAPSIGVVEPAHANVCGEVERRCLHKRGVAAPAEVRDLASVETAVEVDIVAVHVPGYACLAAPSNSMGTFKIFDCWASLA